MFQIILHKIYCLVKWQIHRDDYPNEKNELYIVRIDTVYNVI